MRVIDYFYRGLRCAGDRPAFIEGERAVSWREAGEAVEVIAAGMHAAGLSAESRIGVLSPNATEAFEAIVATFRLGAMWTPINARNTPEANKHWLELMGCNALFYHSTLAEEARALQQFLKAPALLVCLDQEGPEGALSLARLIAGARGPAPQSADGDAIAASVFPTGGTTGLSKAAVWSHRTWETLVSAFWQVLPIETPPVHLVAGPMTHAAGVLAMCALAGGATNVILPKAEPGAILEAIQHHKITHLYLPPTLVYALLAHPDVRTLDFSALRYLVIAASPIAPSKLREAMEVFGPVVCQCYGQAEAPMFISFLSTHDLQSGPDSRWASCGRATLMSQVEIMDDDGAILTAGQRGEIVTKGPLVMAGYFRNDKATAESLCDGWRRTGDIGFMDEAGFITIVDRAKDMIITGGFNVFSAEVEQLILRHPAVLECAVVGVPDPKWGEAVKAVVQLKPGQSAKAEDIIASVKDVLGGVHAPKSVEFWPDLPRSPAGKILKRDIRARFWEGQERAVG